jgi:hypothetical protein
MRTEGEVDHSRSVRGRVIHRFDDGTLFALTRRQVLIRYSDGRPWAYVSDDRLISARSGECLAVRVGSVYYDAESREPMYYEASTDRAETP